MSLLTIVFHFFFCTHLRPDGCGRVACSDCRKKKAEMKSALREQQEIERQQIIQSRRRQEHNDHCYELYRTNYSVELRNYISDAYEYCRRPSILDEANEYYNEKHAEDNYFYYGFPLESERKSDWENRMIRICFTHQQCKFSSEVMSALKSFQDDVNARYLSVFMFCNYRELLDKLEANKELRYYKLSSC
jgi:hypothetical protein